MGKNKDRILCDGSITLEFRGYQKDTLKILRKMDEEKESFSTIVNLPTGGGKTYIAIQFCLDVLKKGASILWIADRVALLEQTAKEFKLLASNKKYTRQFIWGKGEGEKIDDLDAGTDVVFASVQTIAGVTSKWNGKFAEWVKKSQKGERKLYVVYDEAHHIGASRVNDFFGSLLCRENYDEEVKADYKVARFGIIGLTATVYRGDRYLDAFNEWFKDGCDKDTKELRHMKSAYGDSKIEEGESHCWNRIALVDIKDLVDSNPPYLVKPSIIKVTEFDGAKQTAPKKEEDTEEPEMRYLADRIKKHYENWGQTAVIVDKVAKAGKLKEFLTEMGVPNTFILTKDEDGLKDFINCTDENKILISVKMLDEGIDIPKLNTLYLYAPTRSQVVLRQRIGRVLRNPEGDEKKARIIWQYYPKNIVLTKEDLKKLLESDFEETEEPSWEMEKDKEDWEKDKNLPIPPVMYMEPLPEDRLSKKDYYSEWHMLNIQELFSAEEIEEAGSVGFYYDAETFDSTECAIYVRDVERRGYRQFLRVLQNDWKSVLRYQDCKNFEQYAKALNVSEMELMDDIKKICFYLSDVRKADTSKRKPKKRFYVREQDIKTFCAWFLTGEISYKRLRGNYRHGRVKEQDRIKELAGREKSKEKFSYSANQEGLERLQKEIMDKDFEHRPTNWYREKEYTELLTYCGGKYIYPELMSMKTLLRMGVCDRGRRIESKTDPIGKEWAFVGRYKDGNVKEVNHVFRKTNREFTKDDWLLIASALVWMPDHIWVTQGDVNEYEAKLLKNLPDANVDKEQLTKEFLMALGYCNNDDILRRQCEIFGKKLPRLIKYILYEKAYKYLAPKVEFKFGTGSGHAGCSNEAELDKEYESFLKGYFVCRNSMGAMSPVKDVIYDYRPYLKAVPYYQGIKPEFLCRMANRIVERRENAKDTGCVIDAFGGSGAYTMNAFYQGTDRETVRVYNDLGIMNAAFYRCLQKKETFNSLKKKVDEIIKKAFSEYSENDTMKWFFGDFSSYLANKKSEGEEHKQIVAVQEVLERTIKECEDDYVEAYNKKVKEYRGKNQGGISYKAVWLEDRMDEIHEKFKKNIYGEFCLGLFMHVERYMHVFMLKVNALYLALTKETDIEMVRNEKIEEVNLAVLFLMYNSLPHRHFYNHCTIDNIAKFIKRFQVGLEHGVEIFKEVKVEQKNAMCLLQDKNYNKKGTVWYLDIPYTETSSEDYVPNEFNVNQFITELSECEGTYIVSSRCNVCLPKQVKEDYSNCHFKIAVPDEEIMVETEETELSNPEKKELNVFSFFNSFVSEGDAKDYEKHILKTEDSSEEKTQKHMPEDKKAKYILIPYTKMQEDYFKEEDEDKGETQKHILEANNSKITAAYVRRMLAATHISEIPVEVMITNADLSFRAMHAHKVMGEKGLYVMPTFKMGADGSKYMVDPVVIIMKYERFMEQMLRLLYKDEWKNYLNEKKRSAMVKYFRDRFGEK